MTLRELQREAGVQTRLGSDLQDELLLPILGSLRELRFLLGPCPRHLYLFLDQEEKSRDDHEDDHPRDYQGTVETRRGLSLSTFASGPTSTAATATLRAKSPFLSPSSGKPPARFFSTFHCSLSSSRRRPER